LTLFVILAAVMITAALALIGWPLAMARRADGRGAWIVLGVLALAIPVVAALTYRAITTWNWDPAKMAEAYAGRQSVEDMVAKLEERLRRQPEDLEGWLMLGRTRFVTNNYPGAVDAFSSAYKVSKGTDLRAIIGYGETLALVDQSTLAGKAGELFEEALKLDPSNAKALFYGGAAAAASNHLDLARSRWAALVKQPLPEEVRVAVALRIGQLDEQLGRPVDPAIAQLTRATPAANAGPLNAGPPSAGPASAPPAGAVPSGGPGTVTVHVVLNAELARRVTPGTPLFVLARDPSAPGPPFAAKRFASATLPMDVVLTEADAMLPGRTIKTANSLVIVARFSASGRPVASSGDLYGEVPYDLAAGKPRDLVIDKQVP